MKRPYNKFSPEDERVLKEFNKDKDKKIHWKDIEEIPKALLIKEDEKLNNESITNGAGYQTAHQVNSAINSHSSSDFAHPGKINGKGLQNLIICTYKEYTKAPTHKGTVYILIDTKELYYEEIKIF